MVSGSADTGGVGASYVSYSENKFWLFYTNVKWLLGIGKDTHNYVVTCDEIYGIWSDPIYLNSSGFDLSLFYDDDGHRWVVNMLYVHKEGGTGHNHAVTVCRSKNIDGPYEVHPQNPIITAPHVPKNPMQKAGHASFVQTKDDEWYMVHLAGRPLTERGYCPLGRETAIEKLQWKDAWPNVIGGNIPQLLVEAPNMTETKWEAAPARDDFDNDELRWIFKP